MSDTEQSTAAPVGLQLAREWPTVMVVGIVTAILGVIVISWPSQTLTVLSILFGIQLVVFGIFRLVSAFAADTRSPGVAAFVGIVGIIAGIVVLRHPFETVALLAVLLGVVWIIGGVIDVIEAIADSSRDHRMLHAVGGLLSIAAGVIVVSWPAPTVTVIAWIGGLYLIIAGLFIVVQAFSLRNLAK